MISFNQYFEERFSLNPKKWFSPKVEQIINQEDLKLRSNARKQAVKYIPMLKKILRERGYTLHKNDFAYTNRSDKKLALSKSDSREKKVYDDPVNNLPYIRTLFTLAHEVGHVLQWDEETNTKENFENFFQEVISTKRNNPWKEQEIRSLHKLWYELDAWVKGMEFIPMEYKRQYKQYAYKAYGSYMDKLPKYYGSEILLRNLLYKLNFDEQ